MNRFPRMIRLLSLALLWAAPVLLDSCNKTRPTHVDECGFNLDRIPPTSSVNVLALLRESYHDRNLDEYLSLFSSDFTFVRDSADVQPPQSPVPPAWGITEEREATARLFQSEMVDTIGLAFMISEPVTQPDGLTRVEVTDVHLEIDTRDSSGHRVHGGFRGGTETFYFRPGEETRCGRMWRIVRWEDHGTAPWWEIKSAWL